jgi:hypothetical protein
MSDYDHNAFVSMYEDMECENPYDEVMFEWEDWEDEESPRHWWV